MTKGREPGDVPVSADLMEWLTWRLDQVGPTDELQGDIPLFINPLGRVAAKRWLGNALRAQWNRACKEVLGARVGMYEGTKHSTATDARRRGVPLDRIQEALRHRDASSTKLYAKLAKGGVLDLLRRPAESLACRSLNPSDATARIHRDKWRGGRDSNPQGCKCPETQGSRPVSRVCPELIRVWELRDMVANWLSS